jgi:hypothetical protein
MNDQFGLVQQFGQAEILLTGGDFESRKQSAGKIAGIGQCFVKPTLAGFIREGQINKSAADINA